MRGIDVFYQLCYFLSLNARNAYIQGRREYICNIQKLRSEIV
jgi:hypothetical protein